MTVYIVLFRGVGGATQLPTRPLRQALEGAGFEKVATYINSGNAIVKSSLSRAAVATAVTETCKREFGFEKAIHVLTRDEWAELIRANPFPDATGTGKHLHAAVLEAPPDPARVEEIRSHARDGERFEVVGSVAYLHTPNGFGTSKMAVRFDRRIGVGNTARNWNTVTRLMEMAEAAS